MGKIEIFNGEEIIFFRLIQVLFHTSVIFPFKVKIDKIHEAVQDETIFLFNL